MSNDFEGMHFENFIGDPNYQLCVYYFSLKSLHKKKIEEIKVLYII